MYTRSFLTLLTLLTLLLVACGAPATQPVAPPVPAATEDVTASQLATMLQAADRPFLLDVREPFEADIASIPGTSTLIPLGELQSRLTELDPDQEIVVYCRSGNRSQQATQLLRAAGFTNVHNLTGGIRGWAAEIDPAMPTY